MADSNFDQIDHSLDALPPWLTTLSGSVFYSGRAAFSKPARLYVLGLNPGGDPIAQSDETITADIAQFRNQSERWSAYRDEAWSGSPPGTYGMQPRVLHMFKTIDLDPATVPASNVMFVRSSTEATLGHSKTELLRECWQIHATVIRTLGIDTIACFGGTAGTHLRSRLGANQRIDSYSETNLRGWTSEAHGSTDGKVVLTLSHPSRANWCNPDSDPSDLVKRTLSRPRP